MYNNYNSNYNSGGSNSYGNYNGYSSQAAASPVDEVKPPRSPLTKWTGKAEKHPAETKSAQGRMHFGFSPFHLSQYRPDHFFQPDVTSYIVDQVFYEIPKSKFANPWSSPPEFLKVFSDAYASVGERVVFECVLLGNPRPRITWLYNNKKILFEDYHVQNTCDTCKFTIQHIRPEHFGYYTVYAENEVGRATCTAAIIQK